VRALGRSVDAKGTASLEFFDQILGWMSVDLHNARSLVRWWRRQSRFYAARSGSSFAGETYVSRAAEKTAIEADARKPIPEPMKTPTT
jgi:hypothetical protein